MAIRLLHLSDIHFKDYHGNELFDVDRDIRNELELDLAERVRLMGKIDSILVGGDIAFSGASGEYIVADHWLAKISTITRCPLESILTVPGNHDIERSKISPLLKTFHAGLKRLTVRREIDEMLENCLTDAAMGATFLTPLNNYLEFAQKYGATPASPQNLWWDKNLQDGQLTLKIRGVNSALVSSALDHEQNSKLVIGTLQCNVPREPGVVNIVLCHHPPSWLVDGGQIQSDFCQRSSLLLFGHVHTFGIAQNGETLILAAGAMQPPRSEANWEPRYNIIEVALQYENGANILKIKIWKRVWNRQQLRFVTDTPDPRQTHDEYTLNLSAAQIVPRTANNIDAPTNENMAEEPETINLNGPNHLRTLAYRFMSLPYHLKTTVAVKLELLEDSDANLNETQKTTAYFQRAKERTLLKEMWDATNEYSSNKVPNPF